MKRFYELFSLCLLVTALTGCSASCQGPNFLTWLLGILGLLLLALSGLRIRSIYLFNQRHPHHPLPAEHKQLTAAVLLAGLILLVLAFITTYL